MKHFGGKESIIVYFFSYSLVPEIPVTVGPGILMTVGPFLIKDRTIEWPYGCDNEMC